MSEERRRNAQERARESVPHTSAGQNRMVKHMTSLVLKLITNSSVVEAEVGLGEVDDCFMVVHECEMANPKLVEEFLKVNERAVKIFREKLGFNTSAQR